jgi:hypothetical protein
LHHRDRYDQCTGATGYAWCRSRRSPIPTPARTQSPRPPVTCCSTGTGAPPADVPAR